MLGRSQADLGWLVDAQRVVSLRARFPPCNQCARLSRYKKRPRVHIQGDPGQGYEREEPPPRWIRRGKPESGRRSMVASSTSQNRSSDSRRTYREAPLGIGDGRQCKSGIFVEGSTRVERSERKSFSMGSRTALFLWFSLYRYIYLSVCVRLKYSVTTIERN